MPRVSVPTPSASMRGDALGLHEALGAVKASHGVDLLSAILGGLARAHAVKMEVAKHGMFLKFHYTNPDITQKSHVVPLAGSCKTQTAAPSSVDTCTFFQRGKCTRGARCKFSHDLGGGLNKDVGAQCQKVGNDERNNADIAPIDAVTVRESLSELTQDIDNIRLKMNIQREARVYDVNSLVSRLR